MSKLNEFHNHTTTSLFMMHYPANEGYALSSMERIFYEVGLELGGGDSTRVHFSFTHLEHGMPASLPSTFQNVAQLDFRESSLSKLGQVANYVQKHDIQLVVAFDMRPTNPLCRYLRNAGDPVIVAYWGAPISSLMPIWKLLIKRLEILLARNKVDGLIFESTSLAELAIKGRGIPERMIDVVPLGVDTSRFFPSKSDYVYKIFDFPKERRIIVSAGHVYEGKGVGILISAAIKLIRDRGRNDVCFLICGNKGEESASYEKQYHGLGLEKYIRFGGYRADMDKIYQGCFCGVVPSIVQESFSFSSVEMAASGLPVIASRIGGLTDAVVDNVTGILFEPGNADELADVIEKLLDYPLDAEKYGAQGRARCEKELSLAAHRDKLTKIFKKRIEENK